MIWNKSHLSRAHVYINIQIFFAMIACLPLCLPVSAQKISLVSSRYWFALLLLLALLFCSYWRDVELVDIVLLKAEKGRARNRRREEEREGEKALEVPGEALNEPVVTPQPAVPTSPTTHHQTFLHRQNTIFHNEDSSFWPFYQD